MSVTELADARGVRLGKNEVLFRSVNERVALISEDLTRSGRLEFMCECAIYDCGLTIELTRQAYEAVRRVPRHFLVLPGHVFPEIENIVRDYGSYVVVEKFGVAGDLAVSTQAPLGVVSDDRNEGAS